MIVWMSMKIDRLQLDQRTCQLLKILANEPITWHVGKESFMGKKGIRQGGVFSSLLWNIGRSSNTMMTAWRHDRPYHATVQGSLEGLSLQVDKMLPASWLPITLREKPFVLQRRLRTSFSCLAVTATSMLIG